jgi:hypothetical protein
MSLEMAHKVIVPPKKNYIPQFLKQRDINSYFAILCGANLKYGPRNKTKDLIQKMKKVLGSFNRDTVVKAQDLGC